jgi:hypothetical protein
MTNTQPEDNTNLNQTSSDPMTEAYYRLKDLELGLLRTMYITGLRLHSQRVVPKLSKKENEREERCKQRAKDLDAIWDRFYEISGEKRPGRKPLGWNIDEDNIL